MGGSPFNSLRPALRIFEKPQDSFAGLRQIRMLSTLAKGHLPVSAQVRLHVPGLHPFQRADELFAADAAAPGARR